MLSEEQYLFTAKKLSDLRERLRKKRKELHDNSELENYTDHVTNNVMAHGIQEAINIVTDELLLLESQYYYKRDYPEHLKTDWMKKLESELKRCTYCGCLGDSDTKHVNGYTILVTCRDCEEEILEGCGDV